MPRLPGERGRGGGRQRGQHQQLQRLRRGQQMIQIRIYIVDVERINEIECHFEYKYLDKNIWKSYS